MAGWLTVIADMDAAAGEYRVASRPALLAFGLAVFAMWLLLHPYWGLAHDSILYTGAALARLHPQTLAHDVFLRFGSQDQYTLFSPLFATAIRTLGLVPAAAILTFCAQILFFSSAWLLARRLMRADLALLAVGLLVVLPSGYGAHQVFRYVEDFLTPRELAEACVLAALAAILARRYVLASAATLGAVLLHPIMAAAGIAFACTLQVAIPHPRRALMLIAAGVGVFSAVVLLAPIGPFARIDDLWWSLLQSRSQFLFIELWHIDDLARAVIPLAVLGVGRLICTDSTARKLCAAGLLIAAAGLAITFIGSDLLRIVIVTQLQTWRWLWLTSVLAVLLIPIIARDGWRAGAVGRATMLLLAAAWIFRAETSALLVGALAIAGAYGIRRGWQPDRARQLYLATVAALAIAILVNLANKWLSASIDPTFLEGEAKAPLGVQWARLLAADGVVPAGLLVLAWWVMRGPRARVGVAVSGAIACTACVALVPVTWSSWSTTPYSQRAYAAFADWRARIPAQAEIFWPDMGLGAWYLLDRANYISTFQTAGLVFSRAAAVEMLDRTRRMKPLFPYAQFEIAERERALRENPRLDLRAACRGSAADFVVSATDLEMAPFMSLTPSEQHPKVRFRLYRCSDFRQ